MKTEIQIQRISRKCGHSSLITDNRHLMSQLHQDQGVLSGCIRQFPPSDSDTQCRIHVKLSSDIVTMAAIFATKMGKQEPQTLVGESWAQFVDLWTCGKSATFHVECWNGEARLYFSTLLGSPGDSSSSRTESARPTFSPTTKVKSRKKYSPSKLKRNQLRLQAFLEKKKRQESCSDTTESVSRQEPCSEENLCSSFAPETKSQETCSRLAESQLAEQSSLNGHSDLKSHFHPPFNSTEASPDISQSPFSEVETLLQRIDSQSQCKPSLSLGRRMSRIKDSREYQSMTPRPYEGELTAEEKRDLGNWKGHTSSFINFGPS